MAKKIPLRQCVGCRQMKAKKELIRVLKTPEDKIIIDVSGKANGRGAYLCPDVDCFLRARKSGGFARAFKTSIPEEVYDHLAEELKRIDTEG